MQMVFSAKEIAAIVQSHMVEELKVPRDRITAYNFRIPRGAKTLDSLTITMDVNTDDMGSPYRNGATTKS